MSTAECTEERVVVMQDGFVVDAESGEVYGLERDCATTYDAMADEYTFLRNRPVVLPFRITDHDSADWAMERKFACEAELRTIEAKRAAMNENFDRMAQPYRNRLKYLSFRFDRELEAFAAANLPKKGKTLALPHGSISFRTVKETIEITDPDAAVKWAAAYAPEIVHAYVNKTDIAKHLSGDTLPEFVERVPERQSCSIKTGL